LLLIERQVLTRLLLCGFVLREQMIVEPATFFKRREKRFELFLDRIHPILQGFMHGSILDLNSLSVKGGEPIPRGAKFNPSQVTKKNN
jgi:hypothetical protein